MSRVVESARETLELYRGMLRIRVVEERIAELYPEQEMRCPVHLCIGQEAAAVGVCAALEQGDYVFGTHRSHGHYLAKGGDLRALLAELYGKATGCCGGKGGSMHLIDTDAGFLGATPIVGSTIAIAVGAAFGAVMLDERRVVAVFFGEGATEEGSFHEAANFAALKELPVVFVCENNGYSVYSPLSVRQPQGRDLCAVAEAAGLAARRADGNDVEAVRDAAVEAVARARAGGGPGFLELTTYRWREHCGPFFDDELGYRPSEELAQWRARCPVTSLRDQLALAPELSAELELAEAEIVREIDEAVAFAKASPFPPRDALAADVYGA